MFKHITTDLDIQPKTKQQRMTCSFKLPGCCCLNDERNEILFRINISPPLTTTAGLDARRGRAMAWPSKSPNLTPMDFFLWSHIKAFIYMSPVDCCCEGETIKTGASKGCVACMERI